MTDRRRSQTRFAALVLPAVWLAVCGCVTRSYHARAEAEVPSEPAMAADTDASGPFAMPDAPLEVDNHDLEHRGRYRLHRLTFPSVGRNGQADDLVTINYHRSIVPGSWPALIVVPIWGVSDYPSKSIARAVRARSDGRMHVLDVQGETYLLDWEWLRGAEDEDSFLDGWREAAYRERSMVLDLRRLVDWAEAQPEIDTTRLAVIGFSHSAILAATLAANEPRIAATVLVFGGAHPHETIARCDGNRTVGLQDKVAQEFGWTQDEYARRLAPILRDVDPATYPGRVDPESVLLFEAEQDPCVPRTAYAALRETMGHPARYTVGTSHRRAFYTMTPLYGNWLRHRVWEFLEARFFGEPGP
jgi:dienelactone hydrolase